MALNILKKNLSSNVFTNLSIFDNILLLESNLSVSSYQLISEFIDFITNANQIKNNNFLLTISNNPSLKLFNIGGDLSLFHQSILNKEFDELYQYMLLIIKGITVSMNSINNKQISSTIINGDCIAGGMTFALSFDIILAEKDVMIGFPTAKHGLFTGIGTFELLSRKVGETIAAEILTSGKMYTAEEMFSFGMVDKVIEKNTGLDFLLEYQKIDLQKRIDEINYKHSKHISFNHNSLIESAQICIERMQKLTDKELRLIELLVKKQSKILNSYE
jgi:DSF synthase